MGYSKPTMNAYHENITLSEFVHKQIGKSIIIPALRA